ncbi:hypothetical protein BESB_033130 [Besnoitia besnoiti]|uniref:Uncharacterized protein n=1 Tax=Besnoitia besnoiti TaxID=94643 RepID=A0A2A9M6K0_BESBE|nr:uncharacterized protein BESB_033130 [Besnoitia besnoiti]PFH31040.1 hypothetical protein BESB_033130 [Besnoitia besnoiti]
MNLYPVSKESGDLNSSCSCAPCERSHTSSATRGLSSSCVQYFLGLHHAPLQPLPQLLRQLLFRTPPSCRRGPSASSEATAARRGPRPVPPPWAEAPNLSRSTERSSSAGGSRETRTRALTQSSSSTVAVPSAALDAKAPQTAGADPRACGPYLGVRASHHHTLSETQASVGQRDAHTAARQSPGAGQTRNLRENAHRRDIDGEAWRARSSDWSARGPRAPPQRRRDDLRRPIVSPGERRHPGVERRPAHAVESAPDPRPGGCAHSTRRPSFSPSSTPSSALASSPSRSETLPSEFASAVQLLIAQLPSLQRDAARGPGLRSRRAAFSCRASAAREGRSHSPPLSVRDLEEVAECVLLYVRWMSFSQLVRALADFTSLAKAVPQFSSSCLFPASELAPYAHLLPLSASPPPLSRLSSRLPPADSRAPSGAWPLLPARLLRASGGAPDSAAAAEACSPSSSTLKGSDDALVRCALLAEALRDVPEESSRVTQLFRLACTRAIALLRSPSAPSAAAPPRGFPSAGERVEDLSLASVLVLLQTVLAGLSLCAPSLFRRVAGRLADDALLDDAPPRECALLLHLFAKHELQLEKRGLTPAQRPVRRQAEETSCWLRGACFEGTPREETPERRRAEGSQSAPSPGARLFAAPLPASVQTFAPPAGLGSSAAVFCAERTLLRVSLADLGFEQALALPLFPLPASPLSSPPVLRLFRRVAARLSLLQQRHSAVFRDVDRLQGLLAELQAKREAAWMPAHQRDAGEDEARRAGDTETPSGGDTSRNGNGAGLAEASDGARDCRDLEAEARSLSERIAALTASENLLVLNGQDLCMILDAYLKMRLLDVRLYSHLVTSSIRNLLHSARQPPALFPLTASRALGSSCSSSYPDLLSASLPSSLGSASSSMPLGLAEKERRCTGRDLAAMYGHLVGLLKLLEDTQTQAVPCSLSGAAPHQGERAELGRAYAASAAASSALSSASPSSLCRASSPLTLSHVASPASSSEPGVHSPFCRSPSSSSSSSSLSSCSSAPPQPAAPAQRAAAAPVLFSRILPLLVEDLPRLLKRERLKSLHPHSLVALVHGGSELLRFVARLPAPEFEAVTRLLAEERGEGRPPRATTRDREGSGSRAGLCGVVWERIEAIERARGTGRGGGDGQGPLGDMLAGCHARILDSAVQFEPSHISVLLAAYADLDRLAASSSPVAAGGYGVSETGGKETGARAGAQGTLGLADLLRSPSFISRAFEVLPKFRDSHRYATCLRSLSLFLASAGAPAPARPSPAASVLPPARLSLPPPGRAARKGTAAGPMRRVSKGEDLRAGQKGNEFQGRAKAARGSAAKPQEQPPSSSRYATQDTSHALLRQIVEQEVFWRTPWRGKEIVTAAGAVARAAPTLFLLSPSPSPAPAPRSVAAGASLPLLSNLVSSSLRPSPAASDEVSGRVCSDGVCAAQEASGREARQSEAEERDEDAEEEEDDGFGLFHSLSTRGAPDASLEDRTLSALPAFSPAGASPWPPAASLPQASCASSASVPSACVASASVFSDFNASKTANASPRRQIDAGSPSLDPSAGFSAASGHTLARARPDLAEMQATDARHCVVSSFFSSLAAFLLDLKPAGAPSSRPHVDVFGELLESQNRLTASLQPLSALPGPVHSAKASRAAPRAAFSRHPSASQPFPGASGDLTLPTKTLDAVCCSGSLLAMLIDALAAGAAALRLRALHSPSVAHLGFPTRGAKLREEDGEADEESEWKDMDACNEESGERRGASARASAFTSPRDLEEFAQRHYDLMLLLQTSGNLVASRHARDLSLLDIATLAHAFLRSPALLNLFLTPLASRSTSVLAPASSTLSSSSSRALTLSLADLPPALASSEGLTASPATPGDGGVPPHPLLLSLCLSFLLRTRESPSLRLSPHPDSRALAAASPFSEDFRASVDAVRPFVSMQGLRLTASAALFAALSKAAAMEALPPAARYTRPPRRRADAACAGAAEAAGGTLQRRETRLEQRQGGAKGGGRTRERRTRSFTQTAGDTGEASQPTWRVSDRLTLDAGEVAEQGWREGGESGGEAADKRRVSGGERSPSWASAYRQTLAHLATRQLIRELTHAVRVATQDVSRSSSSAASSHAGDAARQTPGRSTDATLAHRLASLAALSALFQQTALAAARALTCLLAAPASWASSLLLEAPRPLASPRVSASPSSSLLGFPQAEDRGAQEHGAGESAAHEEKNDAPSGPRTQPVVEDYVALLLALEDLSAALIGSYAHLSRARASSAALLFRISSSAGTSDAPGASAAPSCCASPVPLASTRVAHSPDLVPAALSARQKTQVAESLIDVLLGIEALLRLSRHPLLAKRIKVDAVFLEGDCEAGDASCTAECRQRQAACAWLASARETVDAQRRLRAQAENARRAHSALESPPSSRRAERDAGELDSAARAKDEEINEDREGKNFEKFYENRVGRLLDEAAYELEALLVSSSAASPTLRRDSGGCAMTQKETQALRSGQTRAEDLERGDLLFAPIRSSRLGLCLRALDTGRLRERAVLLQALSDRLLARAAASLAASSALRRPPHLGGGAASAAASSSRPFPRLSLSSAAPTRAGPCHEDLPTQAPSLIARELQRPERALDLIPSDLCGVLMAAASLAACSPELLSRFLICALGGSSAPLRAAFWTPPQPPRINLALRHTLQFLHASTVVLAVPQRPLTRVSLSADPLPSSSSPPARFGGSLLPLSPRFSPSAEEFISPLLQLQHRALLAHALRRMQAGARPRWRATPGAVTAATELESATAAAESLDSQGNDEGVAERDRRERGAIDAANSADEMAVQHLLLALRAAILGVIDSAQPQGTGTEYLRALPLSTLRDAQAFVHDVSPFLAARNPKQEDVLWQASAPVASSAFSAPLSTSTLSLTPPPSLRASPPLDTSSAALAPATQSLDGAWANASAPRTLDVDAEDVLFLKSLADVSRVPNSPSARWSRGLALASLRPLELQSETNYASLSPSSSLSSAAPPRFAASASSQSAFPRSHPLPKSSRYHADVRDSLRRVLLSALVDEERGRFATLSASSFPPRVAEQAGPPEASEGAKEGSSRSSPAAREQGDAETREKTPRPAPTDAAEEAAKERRPGAVAAEGRRAAHGDRAEALTLSDVAVSSEVLVYPWFIDLLVANAPPLYKALQK